MLLNFQIRMCWWMISKLSLNFIRKVFTENASKLYMHFGDIDAGGLYILKHLRNRTGIEFVPMYMDVETLKKYDSCVKPLTKEDLARLKRLK